MRRWAAQAERFRTLGEEPEGSGDDGISAEAIRRAAKTAMPYT
jgi:hypothetical protein